MKDDLAKMTEAERPQVCGESYNWDKTGPEIDGSKLCALGLNKDGGKEYVDICNVSFSLTHIYFLIIFRVIVEVPLSLRKKWKRERKNVRIKKKLFF